MGRATFKVAAAAALVIFCHLLPAVTAHAVLMKPKSRNQLALDAGTEKCSWCSQSGGPPGIGKRGGGWPSKDFPDAHGLCGDPHQTDENTETFKGATYMKQGAIQATYNAGDIVEFEIGINTWHQGHYEFRICDTGIHDGIESPKAGQDCLNKHLLKRAPLKPGCGPGSDFDCQPVDPTHPERWMQSPQNANMMGTKYDGTKPVDWTEHDGQEDLVLAQEENNRTGTINRVEKMRYIIPEDLNCEKCTLQWYWSSGNNCHYDSGDQTILTRMKDAGWNIGQWSYLGPSGRVCSSKSFGEEFWNCADIAVKGKAAPTPSPGGGGRRRKTTTPPTRRRKSQPPTTRRRRKSSTSRRRRRTPTRRRRRKSSTRRRRKR